MKLYMKVTRDEYELPLAVADTQQRLAEMLGVSVSTIANALYQAKKTGGSSVYKEVEVEE